MQMISEFMQMISEFMQMISEFMQMISEFMQMISEFMQILHHFSQPARFLLIGCELQQSFFRFFHWEGGRCVATHHRYVPATH